MQIPSSLEYQCLTICRYTLHDHDASHRSEYRMSAQYENFLMFNITTKQQPLSFEEYPRLGSVFNIWDDWRGDRKAPPWEEVKLIELPVALISQTLVCDVVEGGKDYKYRFWGTGSVALYKHESTGRHLSEFGWSEELVARTREQLAGVISTQEPALYYSIFTTETGAVANKVNLRMPLMDEPGLVTKIITTFELYDLGMNPEEKLGGFTRNGE